MGCRKLNNSSGKGSKGKGGGMVVTKKGDACHTKLHTDEKQLPFERIRAIRSKVTLTSTFLRYK